MTLDNSTDSSTDPLGRSPSTIAIELLFCTIIMLASLCGNILVVVSINRETRLKTITNIFIQNLAWTDISMALFHMPFWFISIYNGKWIFSQQVCDFQAATMFAFGSASITTMAVISINRYFKIVRPQKYNDLFGSKKRVLIYCVLTWIVGVFFAMPPVYGWGVYKYHRQFIACSLIWEHHISFVVIFLGGFVNGITITIFICYYKIYKVVKQSSQNVASHGNGDTTSITDIKILKSTFAVVCGYVCCWMPVSIVCLTETIGGYPPRAIYAVSIYLMYSSSCINPIIYGILNPQFRRAFIGVFRCQDANAVHSVSDDPVQATISRSTQPSVISAVKSARRPSTDKQASRDNPGLEISEVPAL